MKRFFERTRPLEAGVSVGDAELHTACTLTGVFTDGFKHYALTNAHCLKGAMTCDPRDMVGNRMVQPSILDGGDPERDVIGVVVRSSDIFKPGSTDTALIELSEGIEFTPKIYGLNLDFNGNIRDPKVKDIILKSGRSTGVTVGVVIATGFTGMVRYPCGYRITYDNILTTPILKPGDSGSPVFDLDGYLIGQGYAGSPMVSLVTPASIIAGEFNVRPVGGSRKLEGFERILVLLKVLCQMLKLLFKVYKLKIRRFRW